uniref:Major facilitator superfamily (MFS) profile domain-containing protein n=1 Tax=Sexangularia sp. CB-2014 TaxID=1486929 RepID=A0A7S1VFL9_9EUKA|mmetsp:Transcript_1738/g.5585  ORF Transcript_1738/g.5585 Transcript_1738/m.5585 type:complete len:508 (+) Transcript_1738:79-1602(+)|eukprot:CAMPEP_0170742292 /NCGR_PEP_ID=MMETSP0437-20130122/6667_1 /TAXON_ID=0 /ORGANISM="Sexangularia sp." /LENGTH=507 /DNA_ID=CAMNT_0011080905 /DNA_START=59 /DNA_END=1582 /DNA_ORIENTATION=-
MFYRLVPPAHLPKFVFFILFVNYACLHAGRKALASVKPALSDTAASPPHPTLTINTLGALDTAWLVAYSLGLVISGKISDKTTGMSQQTFLLVGTVGTTVSAALVAVLASPTQDATYILALGWTLNGAAQSIGWPTSIGMLTRYFGAGQRGVLFGAWSSCVSLGNVAGGALGAAVLAGHAWPAVFSYSALVTAAAALLLFFSLHGATPPPTHEHVALPHTAPDDNDDDADDDASCDDERNDDALLELRGGDASDAAVDTDRPVSLREALLLPGVLPFAATNACTKGVSYSLLFWLPLYLTQHLHEAPGFAVAMATLYDVGGVVGGLVFGYLSDKMLQRGWPRSVSIAGLLLGSGVTVQVYYAFGGRSLALNVVLMLLVGAFANSAYNLINSTIAADLGSQTDRLGGRSARSTVTGIIDASGSAGAALSQPLVAQLDTRYGWAGVFVGLTLMCCLSCCFIGPTVWRDIRARRARPPAGDHSIAIEPLLQSGSAPDDEARTAAVATTII